MTRQQPDIQNSSDVKHLVDTFYKQVLDDQVIGHIFRGHMEITIQEHLPKMYRFWESLLLDESSYRGNPMLKHIELDRKISLTDAHFDHWISLWTLTIDNHYSGHTADLAKEKAIMLKDLMKLKIARSKGNWTS